MKQLGWLCLLLVLASLACNLASTTEPENTAVPLRQNTSATQAVVVVTATAASTQTTEIVSGGSSNNTSHTTTNTTSGGLTTQATTVVDCYLETDWIQYWVAAGDTLNKIAERTQSTVAELTQANCLDNPNNLSIGQLLFLPRPPISTPTPRPNIIPTPSPGGEQTGFVSFSNPLYIAARGVSLMPEVETTLTYAAVPSDADFVEFFLRKTDGSVTTIGADYDIAGVAMATWLVPSGLAGAEVYAVAYADQGRLLQTSLTQAVFTNHTRNGYVDVNPYEDYTQGTYTIREGQNVTFVWKQAPTTGQTSFMIIGFEGERSNMANVANTAAGAVLEWSFPPNIYPYLLIYAISQRPDGSYALSEGYLSLEIVE